MEDFQKKILNPGGESTFPLPYEIIVIGTSAGGLDALGTLFPQLDPRLPVPVIVVQHISSSSDSYMLHYFDRHSKLKVKEAEEKELLAAGTVYFAPPDYHVLIETDGSLSLSNEEKVNFSRPSIDVLFETAVWAYGSRIIGIILTGANSDGAHGCELIRKAGGMIIVQDPSDAAVSRMPEAVMEKVRPDHILPLGRIAATINGIFNLTPTR
jgi:two-component system chemotaxis response regulator CheB